MHIRDVFLDFFIKKGHVQVDSASLVPEDHTLMFTNSGMVQFKKYFLGMEDIKHKNIVSVQKCMRAGGKHNDLDSVGFSPRHHTFFEMLGNFSFGGYFKEEAIVYAWEFLTEVLSLDKNRLYITVYHDDDFAFNIWKKLTSFDDSKIIRIATDDNFWSMGEVGPCGPCSEIFYDHGEKINGYIANNGTFIGDRFVEIWNLVFMQFNRDKSGKMTDLPLKCIDTGMGLERILAVLSNTHDNYQSEFFKALIEHVEIILEKKGSQSFNRVIADHVRAISFMIADGIFPGNEGRSYILRKIIRRAATFVKKAGYSDPILHKAFVPLISSDNKACMSYFYHELTRAKDLIASILLQEEENFFNTVKRGWPILKEAVSTLKAGDTFSGKTAFKLYDTYGFPIDITNEFLAEYNLYLDTDEFEKAMKSQKEIARKNWCGSGDVLHDELWGKILNKYGATDFCGYDLDEKSHKESKVLHIVYSNCDITKEESIFVVLDSTPFYAESGGQCSDRGEIKICNGEGSCGLLKVLDVQKMSGAIYAHKCKLISGNVNVGNIACSTVDLKRRQCLSVNHSATHILHHALRKVLGEHVTQKGSMVEEDFFRFDFSHNKALSVDELQKVSSIVDFIIRSNAHVETNSCSFKKAVSSGAISLFGEKYGEYVRIVNIGPSSELCGGTHVSFVGEIGFFVIISESSVAFGVRRIEAFTGEEAVLYIEKKISLLSRISSAFKCEDGEIEKNIANLKLDNKRSNDLVEQLYVRIMESQVLSICDDSLFIVHAFEDIPFLSVRNFAIKYSKKLQRLCVFGSLIDKKALFCIVIPDSIKQRFDALTLVKDIKLHIPEINGGGNKVISQISCPREYYDNVISAIKENIRDNKI